MLLVDSPRYAWLVYQRGEYVVFRLPFHNSGGEKEFIGRDGLSRVKMDVD